VSSQLLGQLRFRSIAPNILSGYFIQTFHLDIDHKSKGGEGVPFSDWFDILISAIQDNPPPLLAIGTAVSGFLPCLFDLS